MSESVRRSSISMPASVLSYFTDKPTEMATDLLLAKKRPTIPEDVAWEDLHAFYKAILAAKQIEVEHAIFLNDLWVEICQPMNAPWVPNEPHQQNGDCAIDLASIWQESFFTREFSNGVYSCEILTFIGKDEGIQIGYGLWHDGENLLKSTPSPDWETPDDILWSAEGAVPITPVIDLQNLRQLADEGKRFLLDILKNHEDSTRI